MAAEIKNDKSIRSLYRHMKPKLLFGLAVLIPLALFFAAREAASWRPQLLGNVNALNPTLLFSPDSRYLIIQNQISRLGDLWDLTARRKVRRLALGMFYVVSPDSRTVAVVDHNRSWLFNQRFGFAHRPGARFFDLKSGRPLLVLGAPKREAGNDILDAAFSPDGSRFVIVTPRADYTFDATTGTFLRLNQAGFFPRDAALSPDLKRVLHDADGHLDIRDFPTSQTKPPLILRAALSGRCGWSPDGKMCWQRSVDPVDVLGFRFWNAQTGEVIGTEETNGANIHFTPDSKNLAIATSKGLELREVLTGKLVQTLPGPREQTFEIAPDGTFAVSVDASGKIWKWRLK